MMFNRPLSPMSSARDSCATAWDVDRNPQFRLVLLWVAMLIPTLAIIGRIAHLQLGLREDLAAAFSQKSETLDEIQARDGRILAADGSILAGDVERYDVAVFYPAIQNPLDDDWVVSKAKPRLSKPDRKDQNKLAAEKNKVIAEVESLWQKLADLADRPLSELMDARKREQSRVERIKSDVLRRFRERNKPATATEATTNSSTSLSVETVWKQIQKVFAEGPDESRGPRQIREELDYHTVLTNIDAEMKAEIEGHPERYPYARILSRSRRTYPKGELASHLIGFRKPLTEEQFQQRRLEFPEGDPQDYHVGDPCGVSGLELSYDAHLKGIRGRQIIVKNRRGEIVETRIIRPPQHGRDLVVTLDTDVQLAAEKLIDEALTKVTRAGAVDPETSTGQFREITCPQGGCLIAMDVHTGAILAAASAPRFDLNLMVAPNSTEWEKVMSDPRSPFLSRATKMGLPPGSVFKIISAVAAIESGTMDPLAPFYCQGYLDRPDRPHRCLTFIHQGHGHGDVTLADALCRSCNVYFYTAARRMGPQPLVDWARKFGIGQPTGIDLPSESSGHLPAPDSPLPPGTRRPTWRPGDTLDLSIGQSSLEVTPLQMVRAMAVFANDGNLVTPHLAADSGPATLDDSNSLRRTLPIFESQPIEGLQRRTMDLVREGLAMVVHHPRGTGYKTIRMKEITIAGKTGTAQNNGVDHAWFAGYVPAEQPRIAFVVVLEHGGSGGAVAGPVAHDFVKTLVEMGLVTKTTPLLSDRAVRRN